MAINLNDNIFSASPKLLDAKWGPFPDLTTAYSSVLSSFRKIGMFAIISPPAGPAQLYWYKDNINTLIPFAGNSSVEAYATFSAFPLTGSANVIYIDKSESQSYYWNNALIPPAYVLTSSNVEVYPSSSGSNPGVDSFPQPGVENVIYIADDTNISYLWNPALLSGNGDYEIINETSKKDRVTYHDCTSNTVNVYTIPSATVTTNTVGDAYLIKFDIANTNTSTLQMGTASAVSLYNTKTGIDVASGDIEAGIVHLVVYTSANVFEILTIGGTTDTGNIRFSESQIYSTENFVDIHTDDDYVQFSYTNTAFDNNPLEINQNFFRLDNTGVHIEVNGNDVNNDLYNYIWKFSSVDGSVLFPTLSTDLHNGSIQTGQTLQFGDPNQQVIITGPTPVTDVNAQRIIIQGQRGFGTGEGGDVYLWAGDAEGANGGDIKIYAGDSDNASAGNGGYINIDAGSGYEYGGNLTLTAGYGYGTSGIGGNLTISAGSGVTNGVIQLNSGAYQWQFGNDGVLTAPNRIEYNADYSASYTTRSLVDKEYVDSRTPGFEQNFLLMGG